MQIPSFETRYADLLLDYSLEIKAGDRLFVSTTTLAEELVAALYRGTLRRGAYLEASLDWDGKSRVLLEEGNDQQLDWLSPQTREAFTEYETFLAIKAPFNLRDQQEVDPGRQARRAEGLRAIQDVYNRRTGSRELRRSLCQYPTQAAAQQAGMSLEAYRRFVYQACKLDQEDPAAAWRALRSQQQKIVDRLNEGSVVSYRNADTDIRFSCKGRRWINSDGTTNMPSGEVYTSPVEDSVEGVVRFDYPALHGGHELQDVTLWVEGGEVRRWEARQGKGYLDRIFDLPGARRFGEAAIGTNYGIDRFTGNILFDEKIGGTIHMALGESYQQCGGKNKSSIHWDLLADMRQGGEISVDGELIYRDGNFIGQYDIRPSNA